MNSAHRSFTTEVVPTFYVYHRCGCNIIGRNWELTANRFTVLEALHGNILDADEKKLFFFFSHPLLSTNTYDPK